MTGLISLNRAFQLVRKIPLVREDMWAIAETEERRYSVVRLQHTHGHIILWRTHDDHTKILFIFNLWRVTVGRLK